ASERGSGIRRPRSADAGLDVASLNDSLRGRSLIMEKMPYRAEPDVLEIRFAPAPGVESIITSDWRDGLPVLCGRTVTLRELRASDAPSLFALLTAAEVQRFISPPPSTVEGFERFIAWTIHQRRAGSYACFAVTL